MSNIPVKQSFTAPDTKQYITAPKLIRGLFIYDCYILYIARILTKCCPILQMLQTLTYVIFCGTRKGSYTTNH